LLPDILNAAPLETGITFFQVAIRRTFGQIIFIRSFFAVKKYSLREMICEGERTPRVDTGRLTQSGKAIEGRGNGEERHRSDRGVGPGIAEKLSKLSRARSAVHKAPDLTETEIMLLNVLAKRSRSSVSIQEVLKETSFSPSRLSKVVKELESRKRLIRSQRVEGDRRRVDS
jgi:hypothetical protein